MSRSLNAPCGLPNMLLAAQRRCPRAMGKARDPAARARYCNTRYSKSLARDAARACTEIRISPKSCARARVHREPDAEARARRRARRAHAPCHSLHISKSVAKWRREHRGGRDSKQRGISSDMDAARLSGRRTFASLMQRLLAAPERDDVRRRRRATNEPWNEPGPRRWGRRRRR